MSKSVVVVGAGLSGLVAAFYAVRAGWHVTLLAGDAAIGGHVASVRLQSGTQADTGPLTVVESNAALAQLVEDAGLAPRCLLAQDNANLRLIVRNAALVALPRKPQDLLRSRFLSVQGKLRVLLEAFVPQRKTEQEESVAQFVARRFGHEAVHYAINPFLIGTYAARPEDLGSRSVLKILGQLEAKHGSVLRGAIANRRAAKRAPAPAKTWRGKLISFPNGLNELTTALLEHIKQNAVVIPAQASKLERRGDIWRVHHTGETLEASDVMLATPAFTSAALLRDATTQQTLLDKLERLPHAPVAQVILEYPPGTTLPNAFGVLVPEREQRKVLGMVFNSCVFPTRFPNPLLTVFMGGTRQPEMLALDDDAFLKIATQETQTLLGIATAPMATHIQRYPRGIPVYGLGHADLENDVAALEATHPGLHLLGNWRGGIGVPDVVANAKQRIASLEPTQKVSA